MIRANAVVVACAAAWAFGAVPVTAEEPSEATQKLEELKQNAENSAKNGVTALNNKQFGTAATEFEYAAQYSRQLKGYGLANYLPPAQDGFAAENLQVSSAGASMFGGGTAVEQDYVKGDDKVTIRILSDSPLLQSMMVMISNPMIAMNNPKMSAETINGQRALVEDKGAGAVQVSLPFNNVYLIQGEGPKAATLAHMKALDYKGLAAVQ